MASKRPAWVKPPAHLSDNPPVPEAEEIAPQDEFGTKDEPEPTRYGDWERKGICWDF